MSRKLCKFVYHKSQVVQAEKSCAEKKYSSFKLGSLKTAEKKSCEENFTQVAQSFAQRATFSLRDIFYVYSNVFRSSFYKLLKMTFWVKMYFSKAPTRCEINRSLLLKVGFI